MLALRKALFPSIFYCMASFLFLLTGKLEANELGHNKIIIAALNAPPYVYLDNNKQPSGILVELLNTAFGSKNVEVEYSISNWARAYNNIKHEKVDAIIPAIKSEDREKIFTYPLESLLELKMVLSKKTDAAVLYSGELDQLKNYSIGKIRKARVSTDFDKAIDDKFLKVEERTSFSLLALAVAKQRLDLIAGDELMVRWGAKQQGVLDQISTVEPILDMMPVYIAVSKKSIFSGEIDTISEAIVNAKSQEHFNNYLRKYRKLVE